MTVWTIGHGAREADAFVSLLRSAGVQTLVDVRRFPGSRRHPQFNQAALASTLAEAGIAYRHEVELGGRRSGEPGEERFGCIETPAFRSYAARMSSPRWLDALDRVLARPDPCFMCAERDLTKRTNTGVALMCAETLWWRCHRRLIAELLHARGYEVIHLLGPGKAQPHRPWDGVAEVRDGRLYLCGELVA